MKATLTNQINITDSTSLARLALAATFRNPKYGEAIQQRRSTYNIDSKIRLYGGGGSTLTLCHWGF